MTGATGPVGAVGVSDPAGAVSPSGDVRIDEGDIIVVFTLAADVPEVEQLFQASIDFF